MQLPRNWFKEWFNSPYYHQLYFSHDEKEAAAFVERLTAILKPKPKSRMIDVACGRGRHARLLAAKGFDVTGIDVAPNNIAIARQMESDHLHFFVHDMRLPFWMNYFDYAFNFFTSFGYFDTQREHNNAIRTIAQSLVPGGILVMDYLNVPYTESNLVARSEKTMGQVRYHITKWFDETHFYKKILIEDEALPQPLQFTEKVARFTLSDFKKMFDSQRLEIKQLYGDYHFTKYDEHDSPRLLMIAEKK